MKYNYYKVEILKDGTNSYIKEKQTVLAQNENWIVLDTPHYEKIAKGKLWEFSYNVVDSPKIYTRENDKYFDNGIFYSCFTSKNKRASTIRKEIEKYINDKYGFLSKVDLSFIK